MTGAERKRVWRERQKQHRSASQVPGLRLQQAQADTLKILRNEIRLKYSLAADNELSVVIPAAQKMCTSLILRGQMPTLEAVKAHLDGKPLPTPWN
jgi:hypothetical protein